jgi:hypothetical protein
MDSKGTKIMVIIVTIIVIIAGVGVLILFNLEKVQEIYKGLVDNESDDDSGDANDQNGSGQSGDIKPINQALNRLLSSSSTRSIESLTTVISSNSEFFPLIGAPIAISYQGTTKKASPLLIYGEATLRFLEVYNTSGIITIGSVGGLNCDFPIKGNTKEASLEAAKLIWSNSDGALIIENNKEGYKTGVAATILASYVNIPVIITNTMDSSVVNTLKALGVDYTLVCGNTDGYGETYRFSTLEEVYDLGLEFLKARFNKISYITLINSEDVYSTYGIAKISCLAPYLSSFHGGLVLNSPMQRLPSDIFGQSNENIANTANEMNLCIKTEFDNLLDKLKKIEMYSKYIEQSPHLAILGDPYSIPFYYFENPDPSIYSSADDTWIATDDFYADLDDHPQEVELSVGRVLALTQGGVSALISRTVIYNQYMECWKADSRVSDIKNAEWKSTAYVAKGDDWNGALWFSTSDYWNEVYYLQNQGYTVYKTQRRATGATASQEVLHYYSSSSLIYVMAHGSPDSYQMTDSVDSREVSNWDMGPSVQILTSCSAARTDVSDIENTISLTFIEVGVNAYIGGTRTENAGASPTLSAYAIESMVSSDETVGIACRDAKNQYMGGGEDNYEESAIRVLYGDPAFNPYQP